MSRPHVLFIDMLFLDVLFKGVAFFDVLLIDLPLLDGLFITVELLTQTAEYHA